MAFLLALQHKLFTFTYMFFDIEFVFLDFK